ncbi:MAG: aspartate/glutamate racemase family protein [Burkholderiaceae bacterium]|nr:aspartate/glutamate racemase family protein [Burkholderiaceae bacterium]MDO9089070.1 aspartate/glutamate racemase family protein [Burkholderiaceae bacterium]
MSQSNAAQGGPIKFWHQSMTELQLLGPYREYLESHARKVLGDSVSITVHGVKPGSYHGRAPTPALGNAFTYHRILDHVIDNAYTAEKSGFDAFIVGSFSEPFLRELRSLVRIPVVSILESSLLISCSLGKKIVPLANGRELEALVNSAAEKHGLRERIQPAATLSPPWHEPELAAAIHDPAKLIAAFRETAQKLVDGGAEVIIPAEGVLCAVLSANNVTEVGGAPVIDVFGATWLYAQMLVRLRRLFGTTVSNVGAYAQADRALVELVLGASAGKPAA